MKITLDDLKPHIALCRSELDGRKAGILGDTQAESLGISLNKEGAIRRAWKGFNEREAYIFKAFLDFFTDTQDVTDDGDNPKSFVVNPIVGDATNSKIVAPGTYRNAYTIVRPMADDKYILIQELRLGFIQELVTDGEVDFAEARVETFDHYNASGNGFTDHDFITLVWKGVDPESVYDIVESLQALDSEGWNPEVNGNALGSHIRLFIRQSEEQDGSSSIRVALGNTRLKFTAWANYNTEQAGAVTYHFGVPTDFVQAVINAEAVTGGTARVSGPDQRGLHDITITVSNPTEYEALAVKVAKSCSSISYMDMFLGLSQAEAEAITLDDYPDGNGISYTLRRQSRGDGFWDVTVVKEVTQTRTPVTDEVVEISPSGETTETQILGYKEDVLPALDLDDGTIKRRDIQTLPDCAKNIVDRTTTPTDQTSQDKLDNEDRTVVVDKHTENPVAETVSADVNRVAGTFERVTNDPTRAGNFQTAKETHTAKDRVTETTVQRADFTESVEEHTATATEADVGSPTDFQIVTIENRESEYKDRFETRKSTRTRIDQETESYNNNRTEEVVTVRNTQADQPANPGNVNDGIRVIVCTPTETNKFEVQDSTETPREFDTGWIAYPNRDGAQARVFINSTVPYFGSAEDDLTAWPYPTGRNTLRISPKNNGRYDLTGFSEPDNNTTTNEVSRCDFDEVTVRVDGNSAAVDIMPEGEDQPYNVHVEITNIEHPNGTFTTSRTVRTFENQTGVAYNYTPTEQSVTNTNTQVDPDEVPGEPEGLATTKDGGDISEYRLIVSPTQTCAKRVDETTVTPIEFDTGWRPYTTKYGTAYTRNIINATEATVSGFAFPGDDEDEEIPDPENPDETIPNTDFGVTLKHERSLSVTPQTNGRYSVSASARPTNSGGGGGLADLDNESYSYEIRTSQGTFLVDYLYTSSITAAKTHLNGVAPPAPATKEQVGGAGVQPGIFYVGRGIFKAVSVTVAT